MNRFVLILLLPASLLLVPSSVAQASPAAQNLSYTISTSQSWIDTGLDLQSGDVLEISASSAASPVPDRHAIAGAVGCDPQGVAGAASASDLPLPSAPAGAVIARLHAQGAAPILIGAHAELRIEEPGHLFLGSNVGSAPPCQGSFAVKVHLTAAPAPAAAAQASATGQAVAPSAAAVPPTQQNQKPADIKQKLAAAAQVWLAGQFATGAQPASSSAVPANAAPSGNAASGNGATAAAAPALAIATAALDAALRKNLDDLPRRVHDRHGNPGDMVNFVLIGSLQQMQGALEAGSWHVADTDSKEAGLKAILDTYEKKDYLQMPMSKLMLFGRFQDYGYEQAEPIAGSPADTISASGRRPLPGKDSPSGWAQAHTTSASRKTNATGR